ncbi:MAG: ShlB/FhaC/HecB family hemolysin secretion/activation protein [Vulcanimicrobiota bacterium]
MKLRNFTKYASRLLLGSLMLTGPALAQDLPGLAEPTLGQASAPGTGPGSTPNVEVKERTMKVNHFSLEGEVGTQPEGLPALLGEYEGRELSLREMKELAASISQMYRDSGRLLTQAYIPNQSFRDGQVKIAVIEGKVDKIKIEGNKSYSEELIRDYMKDAVQNGTFKTDEFERSLLLLNDLPDMKVSAHLVKGSQKGVVDAVLKVEEDKTFHVNLDYNNFGSRFTGEQRLGLGFDIDNIAGNGDNLYLRSVLSFLPTGSVFYNLGYRTPINSEGTSVGFDYANGAFTAGREFAILDVRGSADIYTFSVAQALERSLAFSSNFGAAISYKNSDSRLLGFQQAHDRYVCGRVSWQGDWREVEGRTLFQISMTQGLGGMANNDPLASRVGARSNFTKFNADVARVQNLAPGFYGIVRGTGQFAWQPLYTGEEFALGGPDTVRGYPQASYLGDTGYVLSAEARWSPLEDTEALQFAAFIDHGGVTRRNPQLGDVRSVHLTGAGIGLRSNFTENTSLRLDLGFPISSADNFNNHAPVLYGALRTRF